MLSTTRFRAKLSRVPFKKRVLYLVPAVAVGFGIKWRLDVNALDESLHTQSDGDTDDENTNPAIHRANKWAAVVEVSRRWDDYKALKQASKEKIERIIREVAKKGTMGKTQSEGGIKREELSALEEAQREADMIEPPPVLDLVVIGAGANGLFVTLEAARRGMSVATFDACDVGGANSGSTPNTLSSFLPHFSRCVRVFSAEEFWQGWYQLLELNHMSRYTTSRAPTSTSCEQDGDGQSTRSTEREREGAAGEGKGGIVKGMEGIRNSFSPSLVTHDVGMVYAAASRFEAWETMLTTALWSVSAALVGAHAPCGGTRQHGRASNTFLPEKTSSVDIDRSVATKVARLCDSIAPFLPFRMIAPSWLSLTSDWVGEPLSHSDSEVGEGDERELAEGEGGLSRVVNPSGTFYMRHARVDGSVMALALATSAERFSRKRLLAKAHKSSSSSSLSLSSSSLPSVARGESEKSALPDKAIILNYCPVQSVGVDPETGLFRVTVRNIKMAPEATSGRSSLFGKKAASPTPSYITLTARSVVNCTGPWVDSLRSADMRGDVGCDAFSLALAGRGAANNEQPITNDSHGEMEAQGLAQIGENETNEKVMPKSAITNLLAGVGSKDTKEDVPTRRLLREVAPEKASGYHVRSSFAGQDLAGESMLMSSSNGYVYFVVKNKDIGTKGSAPVRGFIRDVPDILGVPSSSIDKEEEEHRLTAPKRNTLSMYARTAFTKAMGNPFSVATLPHVNSALTLTSDAARRYVTLTPYGSPGDNYSIVGISTVALPLFGWRGEPSLSGLPFTDTRSHFSTVYKWLRDLTAESGIVLPSKPLSCVLSASGTLAPLSPIAREVYHSGGAVEAVRVEGAAEGSFLYHVIGGTWLTARRLATDVVEDIRKAEVERQAFSEAADTARTKGSTHFARPTEREISTRLFKAEEPFKRPLHLWVTSNSRNHEGTTQSHMANDEESNKEAAETDARRVAGRLIEAMTGDPYVVSLVDVIGRRTNYAHIYHKEVYRMLPALVDAMAAQQPAGYEWSASRRSEELAAARAFMEGIAPPA